MTDVYTALADPTTKVTASLDTGSTITSLHPALHVEERQMLESLRLRSKAMSAGASAVVYSNYFRGSSASPTGYIKPSGTVGSSGTGAADFTYQCDGIADHVELQAAIDKVYGQGGGSVLFLGPLGIATACVKRRTGVKVFGEGRGSIWRAGADFTGPNYGMFQLYDELTHATELSGFTLDGDSKNCYGVWDTANTSQAFDEDPATNPDAFNIVKDLYIYRQGDGAFAGHGLRTSGGNLRACRYTNIRFLGQSGCCLWVDNSVDSHYDQLDMGSAGGNGIAWVASDTAPVGFGAYINGDDNYFFNSKSWFSDADGWYVNGVRNTFAGIAAQDNGGYGINMNNGKNIYSGIKCDSNGRLLGAGSRGRNGIKCTSNYNNIQGISYDKGEGGTFKQQYGIEMASGTDKCDISVVTYGNVAGASTGTANASSRVWISAQ